MPYRSTKPYLFRLSARIVVFGVWTALFGLFILFFTVQMLSTLSGTNMGPLESGAGMDVTGILVESIVTLFRGGFVALGVGGTLMAFGSMFIITVVK